jgi:phage baseplate assembly protein W
MSVTISYPFTLDPLGRIVTTSDANKIYLDKVMILLSTAVGQRPMNPLYGTDIFRALYECGGDYNQALIEVIQRAMATHLPMISVEEIEITDPDDSGISLVNISFGFPDGTTEKVSLNSSYLNPDGTKIGDIV